MFIGKQKELQDFDDIEALELFYLYMICEKMHITPKQAREMSEEDYHGLIDFLIVKGVSIKEREDKIKEKRENEKAQQRLKSRSGSSRKPLKRRR